MWQDIIELWDKALPFMKSFGLIALKIIILLVVGYYLSRFIAKKIKFNKLDGTCKACKAL